MTSFAREMVAAVDNLQRAVASVPVEAKADASPAMQSFIQGIELTERDLLSRMARFKVQPIETVGSRFDPNRHEALFEMPDESCSRSRRATSSAIACCGPRRSACRAAGRSRKPYLKARC